MKAQLGLHDGELDQMVALTLFGVEGGAAAAQRLLDAGVTAVVCGSDLMALGASAPPANAASRCPGTSRWSATTTRR